MLSILSFCMHSVKRAIFMLPFFLFCIVPQSMGQRGGDALPVIQDGGELKVFLDGFIGSQLKAHDIAGAVVSIVQDGRVLLTRGYGLADMRARRPVDPEKTLFRPGSISKLFTWTAVMQLAERGKLDLDADVNDYLTAFKIPLTFPEPVTLRHIMTHTPGFEDRSYRLFVRSEADLLPHEEYLKSIMPDRVYPPGTITAYSNYGTSLAGYIVERISGLPFEEYVEERILLPLGMTHSTFRQPLPGRMRPDASGAYVFEDGRFEDQGFEFVTAAPAGAMSTTAADMAKFMIAHLQNGLHEGTRILADSTAREMHRHVFTNDPRVSGWTLGFMEMRQNGEKIIWHGGDTFWHHSAMILVPDQRFGIFFSYNSLNGAAARSEFIEAFFDRYFHGDLREEKELPPGALERARESAGSWTMTRINYSTLEKCMGLIPITVSVMEDTSLLISAPIVQEISRWREIETDVYRKIDDDEILVFTRDSTGSIAHMFIGNNPTTAFFPTPWYGNPFHHVVLFLICVVLFAVALLVWPIHARVRKRRELIPPPVRKLPRIARVAAWGLCCVNILFVIFFVSGLSNPMEIVYGIPPLLQIAFLLSTLSVPFTIAVSGFTILAWFGRRWDETGRIWYTTIALAGVGFLCFLYYWNLIGWDY